MKRYYIPVVIFLSNVLNANINYWPMFRYIPRHTGQSIYCGPDCCDEKWKIEAVTYDYYYSSSAVRVEGSDTMIYIGNRAGMLYKIKDLGPGSVMHVWQYTTAGAANASPLIDDSGLIYAK